MKKKEFGVNSGGVKTVPVKDSDNLRIDPHRVKLACDKEMVAIEILGTPVDNPLQLSNAQLVGNP